MRKLKALFILGLFAFSTTKASDFQEGDYKCTHDHNDHPEPEVTEIEEDFNPEGNDHSGRLLASYNGLRTWVDYSKVGSSYKSYFSGKLIPPVVSFLEGALKVKYPVSGKLKFSSSSVCSISTPSALKSGVDADFVWFIIADGTSGNIIATSSTCNSASGTNRPIAGKTTLGTSYFKATTDVLVHEKNMVCVIHEVFHILGFAKSQFSKFISASGKRLSGHTSSVSLDGATSLVVNVEPLTSRLREHFGCSSMKGAYMENSGGSGTMGSHFDRRHFGIEMMTSGITHQQPVSEFSLALMEGSGWYVPDYTYADTFTWGKGDGCKFLSGTCSPSTGGAWCSGSTRACTEQGRGGGSCGSDDRSNGCKYIKSSTSYDCDNSNADNSARLPGLQAFGRDANSKCFAGTLSSSSGASQTTFCFKNKCEHDGKAYTLTLTVGNQSIKCTKAGSVSVSGYKGSITCPDPADFCTGHGKKVCPRGCMGQGQCVDGICKCDSGFKGKDCALPSSW